MGFQPVEVALSEQALLMGALVALLLVAQAFKVWRLGERRTLRPAIGLLLLALGTLVAVRVAGANYPQLSRTAMGFVLVLGALGAIQVAMSLLFRGVLPAVGLTVPRLAPDLGTAVLSLAVVFVALRQLGVEPAQLVTTSAVVTAMLVFAMQDTLGNMLGGIVLQLDHSIRVGDWVQFNDVDGRVVDVRWRYTAIETRGRELIMVPNSLFMKNRFSVVRPSPAGEIAWRRVIELPVDAHAEPSAVMQALERAVTEADIPNALRAPGPSAILFKIASGVALYHLRYWLSNPQVNDPTDSMVRTHALAALKRSGFKLGVPQEEHLNIQQDKAWRTEQDDAEESRRLRAIQATDLFAKLSQDEQRALASHLMMAPFAAGDIITRQGNVAHWLYLVVRGRARVYVEGTAGRTDLAMLEAGSVFGELGMLMGAERSATVVAETSVECYRLDKDGFAQILQARPEIAEEIAATIERRSEQRHERLASASASGVDRGDLLQRVRRFFSISR
jgi:small-conductance mechanosensitive channel/CRP-like cAMP-binding protein